MPLRPSERDFAQIFGGDAAAVVLDFETDAVIAGGEQDPCIARLRMAGDVGQRFLERAVHGVRKIAFQSGQFLSGCHAEVTFTPERFAKSSTSQAVASGSPRSSSISGRRSAAMRRIEVTV